MFQYEIFIYETQIKLTPKTSRLATQLARTTVGHFHPPLLRAYAPRGLGIGWYDTSLYVCVHKIIGPHMGPTLFNCISCTLSQSKGFLQSVRISHLSVNI